MIDTMAFLLVFFMIASLAMSQQAGLPVNLPRAGTADAQTWGDRSLVVTLASDGGVYLNKEAVSRAALSESIQERLAQRPDLVVVINADETIQHREVVKAMDAAKKAGAARMAIATRANADARE
jgi:biopolymer transport protein ExbD